jgi:hypothetical protein
VGHAAYDLGVTDREVVLGTGDSPRPRRRVRDFVANRSATQRLGVVGAVLVLATAPFGGLRSASEQDVVPLELGQRIDIGPFYVTLDSVTNVGDLSPAVEAPEDGSRLLVIRIEVSNHTDRAELATLVPDAFGGEHTGAVAWEITDDPLRVFDRNDAVEVPGSDYVNPGQTYEWALVLKQRPDTDLDRVELEVYGYTFESEDTVTTLDPDRWAPDEHPLAEGHVPIEVES